VLLTTPGGGDRQGDRENPVFEPGLHVPKPALERGSLVPVAPAPWHLHAISTEDAFAFHMTVFR
jgi:hypothetical protein